MKRYLKILFISWLVIVLPVTAILWLIDPFRIFHKPWVRDNYYYYKTRIQASGIINTVEFNSIILGSSMAANFSPNEATTIFGSKFVNLSLEGSSLAERSIVLGYVLRKKEIHNAIISLDWETLATSSTAGSPIEHYSYLYDENRWNDLLIYTSNADAFRFLFCRNSLFHNDHACRKKTRSLESLVGWQSNPDLDKRFGGVDNWLVGRDQDKSINFLKGIADDIKLSESSIRRKTNPDKLATATSKHKLVFERYLLTYAAKYPGTNFYLYFPPYSRLRYALLAQGQPQVFSEYLEILRFIVRISSVHPNIQVFGFETEDFPDDIGNYMDTGHYHQRFNSMMLNRMSKSQHQLTPSNIESYIAQISSRANNYSIREIGEKINAHLSRN